MPLLAGEPKMRAQKSGPHGVPVWGGLSDASLTLPGDTIAKDEPLLARPNGQCRSVSLNEYPRHTGLSHN